MHSQLLFFFFFCVDYFVGWTQSFLMMIDRRITRAGREFSRGFILILVCSITQPDPSLSGLAAVVGSVDGWMDGWKGTDIDGCRINTHVPSR